MLYIEDALEGINSPFDYQYVKLLRIMMKSIFFWPGHLFGEKTWKISKYQALYPIFLKIVTIILNIAYLCAHGSSMEFLDIGNLYLTTFLTILTMSRCIVMPLNSKFQDILVKFFTSTHLFYHAGKSEYAKMMHIKMHRICHIVSCLLFVEMMCGLTFFNIIPMYSNYSSGKYKHKMLENTTFELSVYLYYPVDATTNRDSYIILSTYNWYASYICSCVLCMNDLMLYIMVLHVYGHFKILLNMMATFPKPGATAIKDNEYNTKEQLSVMYSHEESHEVSLKLKECVDYHRFLLDLTSNMSNAFGPMLLFYFLFHQAACCLLLLECSAMSAEALICYGPLTLYVFSGLIQLCSIFEIIGTASEKLKDEVYALPWECMDLKNRKLVLIFLMNTQNPVHVKAMGVVDVGFKTMTTIIKTSVSYFTFLRTVPE